MFPFTSILLWIPETVPICLSLSPIGLFGPVETNVNIFLIIVWIRQS